MATFIFSSCENNKEEKYESVYPNAPINIDLVEQVIKGEYVVFSGLDVPNNMRYKINFIFSKGEAEWTYFSDQKEQRDSDYNKIFEISNNNKKTIL